MKNQKIENMLNLALETPEPERERSLRGTGALVAINVSFGNTYIVGTGEEKGSGSHTSGQLKMGTVTEVPMTIGEGETSTNLRLWKSHADDFDVLMITPWGRVLGPMRPLNTAQELQMGNMRLRVYHRTPGSYIRHREYVPADAMVSGNEPTH